MEVIREVIKDQLATKRDLKKLELRLLTRFGAMLAAAVAILMALMR